jgi:Putative DNA-binding domain
MSALTTLAAQQSALLETIFTTNNIANLAINTSPIDVFITKNRGLETYRANANASATRSLQTSYPVVAQLLGEEAFEHLARDLWAQHPPQRGDLAQWGGDLPVFIASISALQTEPYLSDVARAEWALHTAATAADQAADLTTFSLLTEHDPANISLHLASGTTLISSIYPIASILTAHLYDLPSFEVVGQKIRDNTAETALVWRQGLRPSVAVCAAGEAAFVAQLLAGKSLLAALDAASFDLNAWLPQAVQSGLLLGARLL